MEYVISAVIVVLCLGCAYFGYRMGVQNRESVTIEKITEKINGKIKVTQTTHKIDPKTEVEVDKETTEAQQNWMRYNSQFNGD